MYLKTVAILLKILRVTVDFVLKNLFLKNL